MARNVVLLCLDTVRYDYLKRYGGDLRSTADQSFENCRAAGTWSVPSHASMFTGALPHRHGFLSATPRFDELTPEQTFLSELDEFRRVGVSANPYASPVFGFDELFDEFYQVNSENPYDEGLSPAEFWHETDADGATRYVKFLQACLKHDHPFQSVGNGFASQLEKLFRRLPLPKPFDDGCGRILRRARRSVNETNDPTFVFVNIMDAHRPLADARGYDRSLLPDTRWGISADINALDMTMNDAFDEHETEIEAYRRLYAAAVEYVSRRVTEFCNAVDEDTAVVVTADHGEQLAESGLDRRFGHVTPDVTEQLLHVPLELVNAEVDADESKFISHLDLGELIAAVATDRTFEPAGMIAAEAVGLGVAHPPTDHEQFEFWNRTARCVYTGQQKYVWDSLGRAEVYEREGETYTRQREGDLGLVPNTVRELFAEAITEVRANQTISPLDDSVESRLQELGYL